MSSDARIERVTVGNFDFDVAVAGPTDGTPAVLLHGFPETSRCWHLVLPRLAAMGLRVYAPDQRGYSPGARPGGVQPYSVEFLVSDIVGLLDALGVDSAHLVGHDWGAVVAWILAARHSDRVRTLTALSVPHPGAYGRALREDEEQQQRSQYIGLFRQEGKAEEVLLEDGGSRLRALYGDAVPTESVDEYVRRFSEPAALTAALAWYRAMTRDFADEPPVTVPTTYVWSDQDIAVGAAAARACAEFVDAPYEFIELAGVSHWSPEEAPEAVADAIVRRTGIA